MRNKKGFTFIELICGMAILLIGLTGISFCFTTSSNTWKADAIKLDGVAYGQAISQNLKADGKDEIAKVYSSTKRAETDETTRYCYLFFNNLDEIKSALNAGYNYNPAVPSNNEFFKVVPLANGNGDFNNCKNINENDGGYKRNKNYGAVMQISYDTSDNIKVYKFDVVVWNLSQSTENRAETKFVIGR